MCLLHNNPQDFAGFPIPKPKTTRSKIWELDKKLLCPIIGTCLEHRELVQIARKMRVPDFEKWSEYRLHVSFVSTSESNGPVTRQLQKNLDKKFKTTISRYSKIKCSEALRQAWQQDINNGDIPAAFWALVTHPRVTLSLSMEAFETIHMLSHQIGAGLRADMKRLAKVEANLVKEQLESHEKDHKHAQAILARDNKIKGLESECQKLQKQLVKLPDLEEKVSQLSSSSHKTDALKTEVETLRHFTQVSEQKRLDDQSTIEELKRQILDLQSNLNDAHAEIRSLESLLQFDPQKCETKSSCEINIGGRTILCVGGRPNLEPQYNAVVSRCQGHLLYHDGGQEDNIKRLECLLASADAVICPTDCVSHDAYWRTKRYCKRTGKPCVFIAKSGISSFAQGISEIPDAEPQILS